MDIYGATIAVFQVCDSIVTVCLDFFINSKTPGSRWSRHRGLSSLACDLTELRRASLIAVLSKWFLQVNHGLRPVLHGKLSWHLGKFFQVLPRPSSFVYQPQSLPSAHGWCWKEHLYTIHATYGEPFWRAGCRLAAEDSIHPLSTANFPPVWYMVEERRTSLAPFIACPFTHLQVLFWQWQMARNWLCRNRDPWKYGTYM